MQYRYDLNPTFDVLVGSKTFSLHTSVFTERSEFFRAARKPGWLAEHPQKPVDLKDEDAEVFNEYMNCVYFGRDALKHYVDDVKSSPDIVQGTSADAGFKALIDVYLLADKLQDLGTANLVIDGIIQFSDDVGHTPDGSVLHYAYDHTPDQSPLRVLMRDYWMYEMNAAYKNALDDLPEELMRDILREFLRVKNKDKNETVRKAFEKILSTATKEDICHYHQHDDKYPKCAQKSSPD
jgi:hypothetical protein